MVLKYQNKEQKSKGRLSREVYLKAFNGLGGPLAFLLMLVPILGGNYAQFNLRNQFLDWGRCYFDPKDPESAKCKTYANQLCVFMSLAALCVVVKKYCINLPCAFQSRRIHAKMTFRILHAKLTEYLSRTPLGVILNRFSNDIDDIDNYIGPILDNALYYLFASATNVFGIFKAVPNIYLLIPITFYIIVGMMKRVRYLSAKRELMRLYAMSRSPIVGIGTSCVKGAPIIRSLGN
jgi:ABC-type multidrug transport system fused ATPase/permease subunit